MAQSPPHEPNAVADEWVFRMALSKPLNDGQHWIQLRQTQPATADGRTRIRDDDDHHPNDHDFLLPSKGQEEQDSLLDRSSRRQHNNDHYHHHHNNNNSITIGSSGWTLSSPYWSLASSILLTVTYFPAWQALAAYPKSTKSSSSSLSLLCCRSLCGGCSSSSTTVPRDFLTETFTTRDVVKVERCVVDVRGIGTCREAVRLYLRPLQFRPEDYPIPPDLQAAWDDQVRRSQDNRRQWQQEVDRNDTPDSNYNGPVVTFALSSSRTDPPLLWKVQVPAISPIAVETVTVFQGRLFCVNNINNTAHATTNSTTTTAHEPTHIYVNGYQSWTFCGSVPRGTPQPRSAMPDVFSRAFNAGGARPPVDTTVLLAPEQVEPPDDEVVDASFYQSDFFTCITSDGSRNNNNHNADNNDDSFSTKQIDEFGGPACILGWLSQHQQFGVINADRNLGYFEMHASSQGQLILQEDCLTTDWAYAQLTTPHSYDEEPLVFFLHAAAAWNRARPLHDKPMLTGWCSWYVFYERISQDILTQNFGRLRQMRKQIPTNAVVVDDGYMTAWGDWDSCKPQQFPASMGVVADAARQGDANTNSDNNDDEDATIQPGLWLAPYAADWHSQLVQQHPDWILQHDGGRPANSANCGKFFAGLDATHPAVREHVRQAVGRAVRDWRYTVLKIDFLYASCLETGRGKYDPTLSRAQAMHLALQTIRAAAGPDVFLIGCGCPIASGIGLVDAMRVSADTGPGWYPQFPLPRWDNGTLPALRAMIRNSINRAPMGHRWWHNDPDCLMLGNHTSLTDTEVASAASIVAMTCGMLLLSDDLPNVSPKRLQIVSKIFPLTGIPAVVLDLHATEADAMPTLLRLWATDQFQLLDQFRSSSSLPDNSDNFDHNAEAAFFARQVAFHPEQEDIAVRERKRTCIHVTQGLGTWTIVSVSNWSDKPAMAHIPHTALLPPGESWRDETTRSTFGFHTFAFWSGKYSWLSDDDRAESIFRRLDPHETEIYHVKPVTPDTPQYVGSNLHFSCGKEVRSWQQAGAQGSIRLELETTYQRVGAVAIYLPRTLLDRVQVKVGHQPVRRWSAIGNIPRASDNGSHHLVGRVIQVPVQIHADGRDGDGVIEITY